MSVYTQVDKTTLTNLLDHYDVGEYKTHHNIVSGTVNSNFFLETSDETYVLTIFEQLTTTELNYYYDLLHHLNLKQLPIGYIIEDNSKTVIHHIKNKPCVLFKKISGESLQETKPIHCSQIGALVADLHLATTDFPAHQANPFSNAWHKTAYQTVIDKLDQKTQALLSEEYHFLSSLDTSKLPTGTIHADLFRDNVLFDKNQVSGIIDFYFACTDLYLIDITILLLDWCFDKNTNTFHSEKSQALLSAYQAKRPLSSDEKDNFVAVLRKSAFRFWLSRLYSKATTPANDEVTIKDPDEFKNLVTYCREHTEKIEALLT